MKILIDIGHPAHVHLFKNFAREMIRKGHRVLFTAREKEHEIFLLKTFGFDFVSFGKHYKSIRGKVFGLIKFNLHMLKTSLRFKPDILLSHGSIYAAQVAWITRKPHISFEDTFNFEQIRLYKPFTACILTSNYTHPDLGDRCIDYASYHELAYLHPNRFTPNEKIRERLGLSKGEKYIILRFVSWEASHDYGHSGISLQNKINAVKEFSKRCKVFISSEKKLPVELEEYKISIPPEMMHDALAFSILFFGESATMATEAAVQGVPAIYLDNTGRLYTNELETKYGIVFNYTESEEDQLKAINKGLEILSQNTQPDQWFQSRQQILKDKIDLTSFLVWFIENYPSSFTIMKEDPGYQERFR